VQVPGFVGGDRSEIELPRPQADLLGRLRATGKPVVAVLATGSAVAMDENLADAVVVAWYPGEAGGTALADTSRAPATRPAACRSRSIATPPICPLSSTMA
jgi:beta-glucosidase